MIISYSFLKEILKNQCPEISSLAEKLIHIGFEVEEIIPGIQKNVHTVKVVTVEKMETEELFKVTIQNQEEVYTVVTSWDQVKVGDVYVHGLPGIEINGTVLTEKEFGSVKSQGMLLSYQELGLEADILKADEKEGLLRLPSDTPIGENFYDLFWLSNPFLNLKIPYNRPDCYSFLGLLREISVAFELSIPSSSKRDIHWLYPPFNEKMLHHSVSRSDFRKIEISNKESCPFYTGIIIENVSITDSPFDIRKRLFSFYIKPINNVVDIANLLMFYYGQPLHTFDFDKIIGKHILVRSAKLGETMNAIDNKSYPLLEEDLVIADEVHPIALAGLIGGKDTEISNQTRNLFIESAYFTPMSISQTSNRLNLVTDASSRFSRGVEKNQVREVSIFASYLISSISGGYIAGEVMQEGLIQYKPCEIPFSLSDFSNMAGFDISKYNATHILSNLEIPFDIKSQDTMVIKVPSFRETDLKETADVVEEILRFVGYDKIIPKPPLYTISYQSENERIQTNRMITSMLLGLGFQEIITDSIVTDSEVQSMFPKEGEDLFQIINPLKTGLSYLSPNKIIQFLGVIQRNIARKQNQLRLFEIGKHYLKTESEFLNIALTGTTDLESWYHPNQKIDFYFSKGVLESFLDYFHIPFDEKKSQYFNLFDDKESVDFYIANQRIGSIGMVLPAILSQYEINQPVYFGFLSLSFLQKYFKRIPQYTPLSSLQNISRDIAFTVPKGVRIRNLLDKIKDVAGSILKDTVVFDVYAGSNIPDHLKSIAIRLILNFGENISKEKIQEKVDQITVELEKSYHIVIRK